MKKYFIILAFIPSLLFAVDYPQNGLSADMASVLEQLYLCSDSNQGLLVIANWLQSQLLSGYDSETGRETFFQWVYRSIHDFVDDELISLPSIIVDPSGIITTNNQFDISTGYNYLQQMRMLAEFDRDLLISLNNAIVTSYASGNTNTIFGVIANSQLYIKDLLINIDSNIDWLCYEIEDIHNEIYNIKDKIISASELQAMLDNLDFNIATNFVTHIDFLDLMQYFTNGVNLINSSSSEAQNVRYYKLMRENSKAFPTSFSTIAPFNSLIKSGDGLERSLQKILSLTSSNLASLNNYFHSSILTDIAFYSILTNQVNSVTNFQSSLETSLNRPSFFSSYNSQNYDNYRDYITNYYLEVASGSQSASYLHTNWFDRIEMLLSALVFSGNGIATNTIDETEAENKSGELKDHLSSLTEKPQEQLNNLTTAGDGLLDVLGTIQNSFSSASLPNEVVLISFSNSQIRSNGASDDSIKFSPDSAFYQLLRSLTTLCWVVMGLLVFYHFFIWSAKKIYSLGRLVYEAICFIIGHAS